MRLYHNPRCSKSRQAVQLLKDEGIEFEEYLYLEHGVKDEDMEILASLDGIIRRKEKEYKELGYEVSSKSDIVKALKDKPRLLERPVLVKAGKAVIGRPPEDILTLL